jgi:hypothetical protein
MKRGLPESLWLASISRKPELATRPNSDVTQQGIAHHHLRPPPPRFGTTIHQSPNTRAGLLLALYHRALGEVLGGQFE